ncbi:MAG: choice-of-anchor D domain-containing protein [Candidatus Riflebacteria bacterium]|nr:choice-of-anchor D domain-containing protein [Candidatus Riflebacteria bacterium]
MALTTPMPVSGDTFDSSYLRVTNVTDNQFVVSWVSTSPAVGSVRFAAAPGQVSTATPVLEQDILAPRRTHVVQVSGLAANTTYYFDVLSDSTANDNGGLHFVTRTGADIGLPPDLNQFMFTGAVVDSRGLPVPFALVYVDLVSSGATTSSSAVVLALDDGTFGIDVGALRRSNLASYMAWVAGDLVNLSANGGLTAGRVDFTTTMTTSGRTEFVTDIGQHVALLKLMEATPSTVAFGTLATNTTTSANVTLTNTGTASTAVTVALSSPTGAFSLSQTPFTLTTGSNVVRTISFTPATAGSHSGTVTFTGDSYLGPRTVQLSGTGFVAAPALGVSAANLGFTTAAGQSQILTFAVSNAGNSGTVSGTIAKSGTGASSFTVAPTSFGPLDSGQVQTVSVTFQTSDLLAKSASLLIDAPSVGTATVLLSGQGTGAFLTAGGPLAFGDVRVGLTNDLSVPITNAGNVALTVTAVDGLSGTGFSSLTTFPLSVPVGQAGAVSLRFAPVASGAASATLAFVSNTNLTLGVSPTVALSGRGTQPIIVVPSTIDFGNVLTQASQSRAIQNTGLGPLQITSISLQGTDVADFSLTSPTTPATIPEGGSITLTVGFAPSALGARTAGVVIASDDPRAPTTGIGLTGTGSGGQLTAGAPSLDFGSVTYPGNATRTLTLTNSGNAALTLTAFAFSDAAFSRLVPALPLSLAPGASTTASLQFAPSTTGTVIATLFFTADNLFPFAPVQIVTLQGQGLGGRLSAPTTVTFGNISAGSSGTASCVVQNTGNSTVHVTSFAVTPSAFQVTVPTAPVALAASGQTTLTLRFAPTAVQGYSGSLTFVTTDALLPIPSIVLSGTGTGAVLAVSTNSLAFGSVRLSNTAGATQPLTIRNDGNVPLQGVTASLAGAGFSLVAPPSFPQTLAAGASLALTAKYLPTVQGAQTGTLTVTATNATGAGAQAVSLTGTGTQAVMGLSTTTLSFGSVAPGATADRTLAITNTGNVDLTVTGVTSGDPRFTLVSPAVPLTVAAGSTQTLNLRFTAGATPAEVTAQLTVTGNADSNGTQTVSLQATIAGSTLALGASSLTFGNVAVGAVGDQTIVVTNTGTTDFVGNASFAGPGAGVMSLVSSGVTTAVTPITLASQATRSLQVRFAPAAVGNITATLVLSGNATNAPQNVALSGTGLGALAALTESASFGNVRTGQTGDQTLQLSNTGNTTLTVTAIDLAPAGPFTRVSPTTLPLTVTAGNSVSITVRFAPTALGLQTATVTVASDAVNGARTAALSGTGVASNIVVSGDGAFGNVNRGQSLDRTFTVQNTGTAVLTLSSAAVTGTGFSLLDAVTQGQQVAIGSSVSLRVRFTPAAGGAASGSLTIVSDAANTPTTSAALTGTGVEVANIVMAGSLAFGNVTLGESRDLTLSVSNTGGANLVLSSVTVTGNGFALVAAVPANQTVAPGASYDFGVRFAPATAAQATGSVTIASNAANAATTGAALSGTGVEPPLRPAITLAATAAFGTVTLGESKDLTLSVSNSGQSTLTLSSVTVAGAGFSLVNSVPAGQTLAVAASLPLRVRFTPAAAGTQNGTLTVVSDAANFPTTATALSGTGVNPPGIAVTGSGAFGDVFVGESGERVLSVSNTGGAALTLSSVTVTGAGFSLLTAVTPNQAVAPGASLDLRVRFAPTVGGSATGALTIASNAANAPTTSAALGGAGVYPALITIEGNGDLGSMTVNQTKDVTLRLRNTGGGVLRLQTVEVTGAAFTLVQPVAPGTTVASGSSLALTVRFSPTATTQYQGSLTVLSNATNLPTATLALSGSGSAAPQPQLAVNPTSLAFGTLSPRGITSKTLRLSNLGQGDLQVSALTVSDSRFSAMPAGPFTIRPGGSVDVLVLFQATATAETIAATVTIASNDPTTASFQVALSARVLAEQAPVADAGDDQVVDIGARGTLRSLTLDGTHSSDPASRQLGFTWQLAGSTSPGAVLQNASSSTPTLVVNHSGLVVVVLTVSAAGTTLTSSDLVAISVMDTVNQPPSASAGMDQVVPVRAEAVDVLVQLFGRDSADPESPSRQIDGAGQPIRPNLDFHWRAVSLPPGAPGVQFRDPADSSRFLAQLDGNGATNGYVDPRVRLRGAGRYQFSLQVTEASADQLGSTTAFVTVEVVHDRPQSPNTPPRSVARVIAPAGDLQAGQLLTRLDLATSAVMPQITLAADGLPPDGSSDRETPTSQLAFFWSQVQADSRLARVPTIELSNPNAARPSFTPPVGAFGKYSFQVRVTDDGRPTPEGAAENTNRREGVPSNVVHVTFRSPTNTAPSITSLQARWTTTLGADLLASLTTNRVRITGTDVNTTTPTVRLLGAATDDGQVGPLSFRWQQLRNESTAPQVAIQNAETAQATFQPRNSGTYAFEFSVSDGQLSASARLLVAVDDMRTRASDGRAVGNAGVVPRVSVMAGVVTSAVNSEILRDEFSIDLTATPTDTIVLDASGSFDLDNGGHVTYNWSQLSGPESVASQLTTAAVQRLTVTTRGVFEFEVVIDDGQDMTKIKLPPIAIAGASSASGSDIIYGGGCQSQPATGSRWPDALLLLAPVALVAWNRSGRRRRAWSSSPLS